MRCPADSVDCVMMELVSTSQEGRALNIPEAVWRVCSFTFDHCLLSLSFQINTLPSNEQEARIEPNEG